MYRLIYKAFLLVLIGATSVAAETRWVEVDFDKNVTLTQTSAILFSNSNSYQVANVSTRETDNGRLIAAIPFESELALQESLLAYAVGTTEDGTLHYSNVVAAHPEYDSPSGYAQAACIPKDVPASMQSQMSLIENLLKIRGKRRANIRTQIEAKLSGDFLEKMQKYETGFGLQIDEPLSPDMKATEIVDRLDRILHTLRKVSAR